MTDGDAAPPAYRVHLPVFEGPLDLLLHLIEQQQLDITLVSLALVTDQYLAHIAEIKETSATQLGEFLAIASRLLVIKSRALLPRPEQTPPAEEDVDGNELVERLREYKRFKITAGQLRAIEERGLHAYPRAAPPPRPERPLEPGEASLADLAEAFRRVLSAHPPMPPVDDVVSPVAVRIVDCIERILATASPGRRVRFSTLMRQARSRLELIVTFMALLELIKQQRVRAVQRELFGEIYVEGLAPKAGEAPVALDLTEYEAPATSAEG